MLVTHIDAPTGGIQKNSRLLLRELNKRGITTFVCARNYDRLPRHELIEGTEYQRSPVVHRSLAATAVIYLFDVLIWLIRNRGRYDVIHCQQMFGPTMAAAVASFILNKPVVTRVTAIGDLGEVKQVRELPFTAVRMKLIRRVKRWVALTSEMKQELVSLGIPPNRVQIIHNSTDIPAAIAYDEATKAGFRSELKLGTGKIGVFVGRLSEEKNLDLLIRSWAEVRRAIPDARLLILGGGGAYRNVETRLRALIAELKLDGPVALLGHVDRPKAYVLASDVFILPSRTEGMSNALVEALACGAAIVATDIPGNAEICKDGENALLVRPGDAGALAAAIIDVLGPPELARRLGAAARRTAEEKLTVERMLDAYLAAYLAMLAEPRR